ncbi:MAG: PKD domain-containing protein [Nocardioidaceae bacterium]|nr:PKD domain-containing protein [Nocardioidaceae bacterium]
MKQRTPLPRRGIGLVAAAALSVTGLVAFAGPASADTGAVTTTISGSQTLGTESYPWASGAFHGSLSFSADADWSQPAVVSVDWDPDQVRQGRNADPSVDYGRPASGTLSIHYSVTGEVAVDTDAFGTLGMSVTAGITTTGSCALKASGAAYDCHLESGDVGVFDPSIFAVGFPYLTLKMVSDVTVTPDALETVRTARTPSQVVGTNDLDLGEDAQTDPLLIGCKIPAGDDLGYELGDLSSTPGLHIASGVNVDAGFVAPNPVTVTPGFRVSVYNTTVPVATSDISVPMSGAGGSVDLGTIQPNNIPPSLGAVTISPNAVEGTPVHFATSATGPCAAGATYSWDFGDGSGPGHTATPQHTYADNGHYTGQVVVTDATGLTDVKDFAVDVDNADPNVTVVPGAPVTVPWGKPLTLKAQAVDPGAADQSTLTYDWAFGDGDSIDNGGASATHAWAVPGDRTPTVNVCDKDGACTLRDFTVHVRTHATTLSYTGPQAADFSSTSTLTASLVDEFGTAINNAPVVFSVDGSPVGTATTNASGQASLAYVVTRTAGAHTVSASYAGSALFDADGSGSSPYGVSAMASTIAYTGGLKGAPNKPTAVSAKVVDALGRPLAGYVVTFVIGSQSATATTNASGVAATSITLTQKPGFYPLTASWAGDPGKYLGASTSAQFSLNKK